jgi:hypothetical protein
VKAALPCLALAWALAGCGAEARAKDIEAALRACDIERARIEKVEDDGSQSPFRVDFGTTKSGKEQADCMNGHLRAAELKPVLSVWRDPG